MTPPNTTTPPPRVLTLCSLASSVLRNCRNVSTSASTVSLSGSGVPPDERAEPHRPLGLRASDALSPSRISGRFR